MKTPLELKYSKSHEWVKITGEHECEVGLTDYAQDSLGDLVFVNLPEVDQEAVKEQTILSSKLLLALFMILQRIINGKKIIQKHSNIINMLSNTLKISSLKH